MSKPELEKNVIILSSHKMPIKHYPNIVLKFGKYFIFRWKHLEINTTDYYPHLYNQLMFWMI